MKKTLFGAQPSGKLHLGNYIGTIRPALMLGGETVCLIANYHAMTSGAVSDSVIQLLETQLRALGVKNIMRQKEEALLLMWKFMCGTTVMKLTQEPQYKSKEGKTAGLLCYPLLMCADIISANCDAVLVGEDQTTHIELYRDICRKLGKDPIETIIIQKRVMSCVDPGKKMSKSLGENHCIFLFDTKDYYLKKLAQHPTHDTGLKNLRLLCEDFGAPFDENNMKATKEELAERIYNEVGDYKFNHDYYDTIK